MGADHFLSLDTPALLVDLPTLERNLARMAAHARDLGLEHWPHTKTHKVPELAKRQLAAGSPGICVAKLGEAEVMIAAGLERIFIANDIVGPQKVARLLPLARRADVSVCVDSLAAAEPLSAAFHAAGLRLQLLLEIDTGLGRCGVPPGKPATELARALDRLPGLELVGIMTYAGMIPGRTSPAEIEAAATEEAQTMASVAQDLRAAGLKIRRISGGSTPRARFYRPNCGLTEIRPGTYIYNDVNCLDTGAASQDDCALTVLATVISRPGPARATLDAGSKALTSDRAVASPGHGRIVELPGAVISRLDEEHAYVDLSQAEREPAIGEKLRLIPNHACPVSNLADEISLIADDHVVATLPIAARGKSR